MKQKINQFVSLFTPYIKNFLRTQLLEQDYISYAEIEKILKKLDKCFTNSITASKIKSYLLLFDTINYETQIENYLLQHAITILRKDIIRKNEKEKFTNYIAKILKDDWQKIEKENVTIIKNTINEAIDNLGIKNEEFINNLTTLIIMILPYSFYRFKEEEFSQLVELIIVLLKDIEKNRDIEEELNELVDFLLMKFNIVEYMNKSFKGFILANLLLKSIAQKLGFKKITSLTEFIIFISCKIIQMEILDKISKKEAKRLRLELTKLL